VSPALEPGTSGKCRCSTRSGLTPRGERIPAGEHHPAHQLPQRQRCLALERRHCLVDPALELLSPLVLPAGTVMLAAQAALPVALAAHPVEVGSGFGFALRPPGAGRGA